MSIQSTTIPICQNPEGLNGYPGIKIKVTNEQGVESFLIGTCHAVDYPSFKDPDIKKIIDKCSVLYTETGNFRFISSSEGNCLEENNQHKLPRRYSYDTAISLAAWFKKIPNISLDYSFPEFAGRYEKLIKDMREDGLDKTEKDLMWYRSLFSLDAPGFCTWKKGNIFAEETERNNPELECIAREKHWAKTLVPHLQTTSQPICIAVGVYHVVGDGLTGIFRNAGLKVEWIAPSQYNAGLNIERILPCNSHSFSDRFARAFRKTVQVIMPIPRSRL